MIGGRRIHPFAFRWLSTDSLSGGWLYGISLSRQEHVARSVVPRSDSDLEPASHQGIDRATIHPQRGPGGGGGLERGHIHDHIGHFCNARGAADDGARTMYSNEFRSHGLDRLAGFCSLALEERGGAF